MIKVADGCIIEETGTRYYKEGLLHREDGPAFECVDGDKYWMINGLFHRLDGPALIYVNGRKDWFFKGERHRIGGPAIEDICGYNAYYVNGKTHREDGPAFIFNGIPEWWLYGEKVSCSSQEEFIKLLKLKAFW
ncbi:hypothetical protein [Flavobacterium sp.]|uniref:hypothetical protein n=1 Tax=Flavobacterium sp. TaxID=239 RepID=UPI003262FB47